MSGRHCFETAWGGVALADGGARFRLWAPSQQEVHLVVAATQARIAMRPEADGWFTLETDAVDVGSGYAFSVEVDVLVPDPAARCQIADVHGFSRLVDPRAFEWRCSGWTGRPWEEAVIYELHTAAFTGSGTFDGVAEKLDHVVRVGATVIELMPVAQFSGERGWGYDGVLLYAPHVAYGGPDGLKRLVDAAHERGIMVFLDVVYNHFGPDGNYLHLYAPHFFNAERHTPWGAAIAYDEAPVRQFFVDNVLYWLEEYQLDGLRFDAVDQIDDQSEVPILEEIGRAVRRRISQREVHLTTEDDRNRTGLYQRDDDFRPQIYTAQWNDDFHHVAHVIATGETDGYYGDYADDPITRLARALAEGFVYQGEPSAYRDGAPRGEPSDQLPPTAFVNFLQNHDQIGNRALGERLDSLAEARVVDVLTSILLLSPQIPLLFMGEEWGETKPFYFFTDFEGALAVAVRDGRRAEFGKWPAFNYPAKREKIPDPNRASTYRASVLDWQSRTPRNDKRLATVSRLLDLRRRQIVPLLCRCGGGSGQAVTFGGGALRVRWRMSGGAVLALYANLGEDLRPIVDPDGRPGFVDSESSLLFESIDGAGETLKRGILPGWSAVFLLQQADMRSHGDERSP